MTKKFLSCFLAFLLAFLMPVSGLGFTRAAEISDTENDTDIDTDIDTTDSAAILNPRVSYSLDTQILSFEWYHTDTVKFVTITEGEQLLYTTTSDLEVEITLKNQVLAPESYHLYTLTPYNQDDEAGTSVSVELTVEKAPVLAEISNLKASFDPAREAVTLTYEMSAECNFVKIYCNKVLIENDYYRDSYVYAIDDYDEGQTLEFEVEAYRNAEQPKGDDRKIISVDIPFYPAVISDAEAEYDLEKQMLFLSWEGEHTSSVDIYQDDVLLASVLKDDQLSLNTPLAALSRHVYKLIPYNMGKQPGKEITCELIVDDYIPRVTDLYAEYEEATGKLQLSWNSEYSKYCSISLNDVDLKTDFIGDEYTTTIPLQPGAEYEVTVTPYDAKDEEGSFDSTSFTPGDFSIPDKPTLKCISTPALGQDKSPTGFLQPTVVVSWRAEAYAHYELYRSTKDSRKSYTWIANIKADKNGLISYEDRSVKIGSYYYKLRQKTVLDKYVDQQIFSALSDASHINIPLPRPTVTLRQQQDGQIALTLAAGKDYVTGFEIYKKSPNGTFKKIAITTGNTYTDGDIVFARSYYYKARSYYYHPATHKKYYGAYSRTVSTKNTVGQLSAEIRMINSSTVKLSWLPAVNADEYEIYYKTETAGDSYALLTTTKKLSLHQQLPKDKDYSFILRACRSNGKGKLYFSSTTLKIRTGFSSPTGIKTTKATYQWNKKTKLLTQKNTIRWNRVYGASGYYIEKYNPLTKKYENIATLKKNSITSYTVENTISPITDAPGGNTSQTAGVPAESTSQTTMKYRISAYDGKYAAPGKAVTITPTLPAPKQISAKASKAGALIRFSTVPAADRYRIYRSNGRSMILAGETEKNSFTDTGLLTGIEYSYYVEAISSSLARTSEKSKAVSYRISPPKVTGISAKNIRAGEIMLKWKPQRDAKNYVIYYSTSKNGGYRKLAQTDAETTSYLHTGLPEKKTVYYRITSKSSTSAGYLVESNYTAVSQKVK